MTEAEVKQWLLDMIAVVRKGCSLTNNTVDDGVCDMVESAINSPFIWGLLWPLVDGWFEDSNKVMATADFDDACAAKMINPLTVIAIVKAIIELWKMFKKN